MRIKVEPGRVIRLTPRKNSSSRGSEIDLDRHGIPEERQKEILALEGVSEVKSTKKSKPKEGDAS